MTKNESATKLGSDILEEKSKKEDAEDEVSSLVSSESEKSDEFEKKMLDDEDKSDAIGVRSWWKRGGMHVNEIGMAVNIVVPLYYLFRNTETTLHVAAAVYVALVASAFLLHRMSTVFCGIAVPAYLTSVLAVFTLHECCRMPFYQILCVGVILATAKVAFCMSVCLHRYASHAAFKCGPGTQLFVCMTGCLANQGGPIWWASQHRKHHKKCDIPGDPHSQYLDGVEAAFSFFQVHRTVEEQFAPFHCDNWYLRILDTWSFSMVSLEFTLSYCLFGKTGLFLSYFSAWLCQTVTLWFNIANHPVEKPEECKAVDYHNGHGKPNDWFPLFLFLDFISPFIAVFVGETNHKHHHDLFALAKRDDADCGYYLFVLPLEKLGLVWDVKMPPKDDVHSKFYRTFFKEMLMGKSKTK